MNRFKTLETVVEYNDGSKDCVNIVQDAKTGVCYFAPWTSKFGWLSFSPVLDENGAVVILPVDRPTDPVRKPIINATSKPSVVDGGTLPDGSRTRVLFGRPTAKPTTGAVGGAASG